MNNPILEGEVNWIIANVAAISQSENNVIKQGFEESDEFITDDIRFSDNYWNFSKSNKFHHNTHYKYDFSQIKSKSIRVTLKLVVIREKFIRGNRFPTVYQHFVNNKLFIKFLTEEKFIDRVDFITSTVIEEFINKYKNDSVRYRFFLLTTIKRFMEELEYGGYNLDYSSFQPVFRSINSKELVQASKASKHQNIPQNLYGHIINCALQDMENEMLHIHNRVLACLIVIIAETGMRKGELQLLEANKLQEISIFNNKEKVYYLEFFTYKTTRTKEGRWTKTKAYPNTVRAYKLLENITKEQRSIHQSNYLFINSKGKRTTNNSFYHRYYNFFHRNRNKLYFSSLTEFEKFKITQVRMTLSRWSEYKEEKSKEWIETTFDAVTPHQFRVHLANVLKDKGLSLEWIQEHMNHMDEEMTKHYFRDDEAIKQTILYRTSSNGTKLEINEQTLNEMSETELQDAYDTINNFLKKKKLNIYKDFDEILYIWKNNPLQESLVGLCRKAVNRLCERQERLATFEKWYYLSPQFPEIDSFDFTYKRFIEKAKIVEHNKKLFESDYIYERAYQLELTALRRFFNIRLQPEYELLLSTLEARGKSYIEDNYPNLIIIVNRLDSLDKEIKEWICRLKLENPLMLE